LLLSVTDDSDRDVRLAQAEDRLKRARLSLQEAMSTSSGRDAFRAALSQRLEAERELADLRGDEYAVDLDLSITWDIGAPLPHLLANERKVFVVFYLSEPAPGWDGTWVQVVNPADEHAASLGVVEFTSVHSVKFGGPNDEVMEGHPLSGKGLSPYGAHRVVNSRWIAEEEQINSVHSMHRGGWHDSLNHYLFCFHDSMFECLAHGVTAWRRNASPRDLLHELTDQLLE
jgi:hypothetical protein